MATISKQFYSAKLTKSKFDMLEAKSIQLRDFKNEISKIVCENFGSFIHLTKFDWITYFRRNLSNCCGAEVQEAISEVYKKYLKQFDFILNSNKFLSQKIVKNKHGYHFNSQNTKTTTILNYLLKFWSDSLIEWLNEKSVGENEIDDFRRSVLLFYNKYSDRVSNLIISRYERIYKSFIDNPLEFKSLTYSTNNRLFTPILNRNDNLTSSYGAVITIGGQKTKGGKINIPVKYSENYHGTIDSYNKEPAKDGARNIFYTIQLLKDRQIKIILTKQIDDIIEHTYKENYYGIDVNIKHNLFCDSLGNTIDTERNLLNDYIRFLKKTDNKTSIKAKDNKHTTWSIKDKNKSNKWKERIKDMLERKSRELVNQAISLGKDHIVLEDLSEFSKGFSRSEEFQNIKYSRLVRLLSISGLKTIIKRIANKHGIQVTFVQSHYTSQTCKCGHISKNNRKTQEIFKCESCGRELNADVNAASNIEDRLALDVLRSSLLSKDKDGNFQPKKLRKEVIKSILYDFYSTQQQVEIVDSTKH